MGRFSDLDILLTEPEREVRAMPLTWLVGWFVYTDDPAAARFPTCTGTDRPYRPVEVWCLPSGVKLSEAFA